MLKDKHILLGVCGGIAAYKVVELASRLRKAGAEVHVVMTEEATKFVTPLTFQEITGNPVNVSMWDKVTNWNVEHIALATMADLMVIAPATGNILGKIAHGIADDMLTTVVMAAKSPVLMVPAMNTQMYVNPITQRNIALLKEFGYKFLKPGSGKLACGVTGIGRLPEPVEIFEAVEKFFDGKEKQDLLGKKVLISAGGTREPIDPVRFITNRSSGKMGYAIAEAAAERGAEVILVSGITNLAKPEGVVFHQVESALAMEKLINEYFADADITIMSAAVSDYRVKEVAEHKLKKHNEELVLELVKNPDILYGLGQRKAPNQYLVGFAAETQNLEAYAKEKLAKKNLDLIVANNVASNVAGFDVDTNQVLLFGRDGSKKEVPLMSKRELADVVLDTVVANLNK